MHTPNLARNSGLFFRFREEWHVENTEGAVLSKNGQFLYRPVKKDKLEVNVPIQYVEQFQEPDLSRKFALFSSKRKATRFCKRFPKNCPLNSITMFKERRLIVPAPKAQPSPAPIRFSKEKDWRRRGIILPSAAFLFGNRGLRKEIAHQRTLRDQRGPLQFATVAK